MHAPALSRRGFLRVTATAAGGMLISVQLPALGQSNATQTGRNTQPGQPRADFAPNAFVRIAADGKTTVIVNKSEMGQGICTSLTMVLAEELDADWSRVNFEFAPVDPVYAHPGYGIQMTGGSTSTMAMTEPMQQAGATARAMLVAAAAQKWKVPASECTTKDSVVTHPKTGQRASYGELAAAAALLPVPTGVPLKDRKDWRLIGKPTHRLDSKAKVEGTAVFSIDVHLPGMLTALVAHPPTFTGKALTIRDAKARAVPGVVDVVDVGSGVAVIAKGFWPAKLGRDKLEVDWDLGDSAALSTAGLREQYRQLAGTTGLVARKDGDAEKALGEGTALHADYELPYLAHAAMEPLNCVVDLKADSCEIWAGTQFQTVDHAAACATAGLKPEQVKLHTTFLGGGFGRRANPVSDYIVEAVKIAKAAKAPVQLIWTRTDDLRAGYYRPMWHSRIAAAHDGKGTITGWKHTIVGQSIVAGTPFEPMMVKNGIDGTSVEGADDMPYTIPNVLVSLHTTKVPVPTLWWRSVGHSHTAFVIESFLDEMAAATKQDPLALRRKLLSGHPRHLGVLELAAAKAGWSTPVPTGRARGIAVHHSFNSYVATVVEVSLERGWPRVHKVTQAVDCGRTINPDTVKAQLEGATGFALTAALYSAITLKNGSIEQSNFHDYRMLRMHEMPEVAVHMVPSDEPPTGVGEPGVPPVAPALCNALFSLTGKRIRRLPIQKDDLA
ncbi:MAG: xanthine dehydrogenase family protein molybdopterin-binding subunit [Planctomycetota bacterium]